MAAFTVQHPDKQVVLKFYGSLQQSELTVELQIFNQGDRNQRLVSLHCAIPVSAAVSKMAKTHWDAQYRPLCQRQGRAIKIQTVELGRITPDSCRASAQKISADFNQWLDSADFQPILKALYRELNPAEQIQILVQSRDRALQQLPWPDWQLLQDYPQATLSQSAPDAKRPQPRFTQPDGAARLRILGIFGASAEIDTASDKALLIALPPTLVEVQILDQPSLSQLNNQLWEQPWDMILFAGHGQTTEDGQGMLYLNEAGDVLTLNDIWYGLRKAVEAGLQLAMFNSCAGLGLLARNLQDDAQIPHMIVMRDVVPDRVAQEFLRYFLSEFAAGVAIDRAVKTARERLQGLEADYPCASWLPVVWQNPEALPFGLAVDVVVERDQPRRLPWKGLGMVLVGAIAALSLRLPLASWLYQQGKSATERGNFVAAMQYLQAVTVLQPNHVYALYLQGFLSEEIWGEDEYIEQALTFHKRAADLGMPEAIAEYGRLTLLQAEHNDQPLSELDYSALFKGIKICLETSPYAGTKASCLKNRAWIYFKQRRWQKAAADLKAAIALDDTNNPHTHCLLAQVLEQQGQSDQAHQHWQRVSEGESHILEQDACLRLLEQR
ncbi:MAG: tetratricopeptide repeat protein [Spirulina sp. SIO3F2]|nr:tetratricopeptide repeat protein [Spirulina sp. SIO3F2]